MAIYSTSVNKAAVFKLYSKKSLFNLDLDNSRGESFSIYNTTYKLNII